MKTILITGFDPFGGEPINPAWEAVKTMDGYTDGDYKVVTQMVPTVRYTSVDTVKAAAEQCQPDFILCVGQAGGAQILQWNVLLLTAMTSAFQTMEATNLKMNLLYPVVLVPILRHYQLKILSMHCTKMAFLQRFLIQLVPSYAIT